MPKTDGSSGLSRREFLASASAAGAALAGTPSASAQTAADAPPPAPPSGAQLAREHGDLDDYSADEAARYFVDDPASDVMVDLLKNLDIDYVTTNAGSSFRGLHESILNYGGNRKPELITCVHEEQSIAMAHGYAKVAGKPIVAACHGTVGIQHAAMAVYNAWCDRVPVVIVAGNYLDGDERRVLEWIHAAQDCIQPIRDYIKWDDAPSSLQSFNESLVRAHKIATTPPMGPVAIVADSTVQEQPAGDARKSLAAAEPHAAAAGRRLCARRGGPVARRGGGAGDRRRPRRARSGRRRSAGRARGGAASARREPARPNEFSDRAPPERGRQRHRAGRRDPRARAQRYLGAREHGARSRAARVRAGRAART